MDTTLCPTCAGAGDAEHLEGQSNDTTRIVRSLCPSCHGKGQVSDTPLLAAARLRAPVKELLLSGLGHALAVKAIDRMYRKSDDKFVCGNNAKGLIQEKNKCVKRVLSARK